MKKSFILALFIVVFCALASLPAVANDTPPAGKGARPARPDVDLASMSSTMVFSQVSNMLLSPDNYMGKRIRMKGKLVILQAEDEENDNKKETYFGCLIADALACCSQGLLFVPKDVSSYLASSPKEGDDIVVVGTFDVFMDHGQKVVHLVDSIVTPLTGGKPFKIK